MSKYTTKIMNREEIAEGTMAFHLAKPAGFEYVSGQTIDLMLINPSETDEEGNMRTFSLASAPHELDLMIATRTRDTAFKRVLKSMPLVPNCVLKGRSVRSLCITILLSQPSSWPAASASRRFSA